MFDPDLALVDVRLPGMTGFDLMDRLRDVYPGLDVILMTGSVSETDATHVEAILRKAFYFIQKPFDRRVLLTLVERCLELRRLEADNRRHVARLEGELAEARAFQQGLLPPEQARLGKVVVAARSIASAELGGDFFDYADAGAGRVALLVSDVAGHGASAAMLTGIVKSAFDASHAEDYAPLATVRRVVEGLRGFEPRRFVTLFCARIDPERNLLEWVNAGHPAGILWGPNGRRACSSRPDSSSRRSSPIGPGVPPAFPSGRAIIFSSTPTASPSSSATTSPSEAGESCSGIALRHRGRRRPPRRSPRRRARVTLGFPPATT